LQNLRSKIENNFFNSYYIETLGCPKNKADSREIRVSMAHNNFFEVENSKKADIIIVNTCSFIKEASKETIETILKAVELKNNKTKSQKKIIVVVGCFAQRYEKELKEEISDIDIIVGTGRYREIPLLIKDYLKSLNFSSFSSDTKTSFALKKTSNSYAYIRIGQGCSRKCGFCVIPQIRGRFIAYDIEKIKNQFYDEKEIRSGRCVSEVILVSQDSVRADVDVLDAAIEYFSSFEEVKWIRLHYLFPEKKIFDLFYLFEKFPKLASYLDIPFQHISERVLKLMNRPADSRLFSSLLKEARLVRKNIEIRSSFILGYPDETEEDVDKIIQFLGENQIDKVSLFSYSHEDGAYAAKKFDDNISEDIKAERINRIREYHLKLREDYRKKIIGTVEEVMIDGFNKNEIEARRQQDSPVIDEVVYVEKKDNHNELKIGDLIPVKFTAAMEYDWLAEYDKK